MAFLDARANVGDRRSDDAAHSRSPDPFEDLVQRYRRRVMSIAYRITGNIDDARDVAQHVFMQMYVKSPAFPDLRSIDRWVYVVSRNEALGMRRRRRQGDAAQSVVNDVEPQLGLEDLVVRHERAQQIRATIALLPAAERHVIELRHLQSMPTSEIATQLGVPVKRVKHDVERAKQRLRVAMRRNGLDRDVG